MTWPGPEVLTALLVVASYLLGSVPFGLWLVLAWKGVDVRTVGSGNIGTTNVYRAAGKVAAGVVLLLDAAKGLVPTALAMAAGLRPEAVVVVAAMAIVGHSKSIFLRFGGGKSVATGIGTVLAMAPMAGLIVLALFGAVFAATRLVSAGSIAAAAALPMAVYALNYPLAYSAYGAAAALYVIIRHRENIQRLVAGEEQPL